MGTRKALRPRLESLESKTVMSAGVATAPVAAVVDHGPAAVQPAHPVKSSLAAAQSDSSITLTGKAHGHYTSTQGPPDTGTHYDLRATGKLAHIGRAVVTGSFQTPGFILNGHASGTLKIAGPKGTLTLQLTTPGPIAANSTKGGTTTTSAGPIILVNDFTYNIESGTGRYANDHGIGTVVITTTPGLSSPTGPGIYNAPSASETGVGRTTLTFESGPVPLA
jgi:hypothetical protein